MLMSQCAWLPTTYKRICPSFAFRNPKLSKSRSKLTIERRESEQRRLELEECVAIVDRDGRMILVVDTHRADGKRFVVRADEKLTAFLELEAAIDGA